MKSNGTKNVNILLLAPNAGVGCFFRPESRTGFSKDRWAIPPLGLWRIGGYLQKYNYAKVEIWDGYVDTEEELVSKLKEKYFDIIGFSITHQTLEKRFGLIMEYPFMSSRMPSSNVNFGLHPNLSSFSLLTI